MNPNHFRSIGAIASFFLSLSAAAQSYPVKPVRIITPLPATSSADLAVRMVANQLSKDWSQQVIVENRPGASGFIAIGAVKTAPADGYTLAHVSSSMITTHSLLYKKLPYDPVRDFDPVAPLFSNHFFIMINAALPWKNVSDLIAAAKARPGVITYGSGFVGSPAHLGAASLELASGTQMTHIPFKETSQMTTALSAGDINWMLATPGSVGAAIATGRVRLLALTAPSRLPAYKDVPTVAESPGLARFEMASWTGIIAPAGTPAAIIAKINRDVARTLTEREIRDRFTVFGYEPYSISPAEMARVIAADTATAVPVVQRLNVSLD